MALMFLPPVYQRGLAAGLAEVGYEVHAPPDLAAWARTSGQGAVVVAPDTDQALLLIREVRAAVPQLVTVALLEAASPVRYGRALGVCTGAVSQDAELDDVVAAVGAATRGFALLPVAVTQGLVSRGIPGESTPRLSDRELAWLRSLAHGATVASLARSAGYSEREMYRLLSAVYEKLGATTRTQALLHADRWGLLRAPDGAVTDSGARTIKLGQRPVAVPARRVER